MRADLMACVVVLVCLAGCNAKQRATGADLYAAQCAVCHGADARGGGGAGIEGVRRTPPDLTVLARGNGGSLPVMAVAETLRGYAAGTLHGRPIAALTALQGTRRKRVRIDGVRLRTARPQAALLVYLDSLQRP